MNQFWRLNCKRPPRPKRFRPHQSRAMKALAKAKARYIG